MLIPDFCHTLPPLAFASVALALMAQVPSMGSCIVISILTQMHCLGALSRKQPEYHCHFGAILTNVYAAVRACGFESDEFYLGCFDGIVLDVIWSHLEPFCWCY